MSKIPPITDAQLYHRIAGLLMQRAEDSAHLDDLAEECDTTEETLRRRNGELRLRVREISHLHEEVSRLRKKINRIIRKYKLLGLLEMRSRNMEYQKAIVNLNAEKKALLKELEDAKRYEAASPEDQASEVHGA